MSDPVPQPEVDDPPPDQPLLDHAPLLVAVIDEQDAEPVDLERWRDLALAVLGDEGIGAGAELNVLFVGEPAIAELNEQHLGESGPTDVLSFPLEDEASPSPGSGSPGTGPRLLGDVVICPSVARRNAPDHAGTYDDEIALLLVHGVLHVLGMDHFDDDERTVMQTREQALLARHHRRP